MAAEDGKRSPGQKIHKVPATVWNNAMDAGQAWAAQQLSTGAPSVGVSRVTDVVKVRNDTGVNMARGEVLCLDDFILDNTVFDALWFSGKLPASTQKPYGVLLDPIPHQASGPQLFGRLQMSGVCIAKIDKIYDDHRWCHITPGDAQLQTDWHGRAEILFKQEYPVASGQWWAVVQLSTYHTIEVYGVTTTSIASGASGNFSVWYKGVVTSPLQTITVHYNKMASGTVASGTKCLVRYFPDENKWSIVERDCP